jgi:hypothetical protein
VEGRGKDLGSGREWRMGVGMFGLCHRFLYFLLLRFASNAEPWHVVYSTGRLRFHKSFKCHILVVCILKQCIVDYVVLLSTTFLTIHNL